MTSLTVKSSIIKIGNSQGLRLPKSALLKAKLPSQVELIIENGRITIIPDPDAITLTQATLMAETVLAHDWNKPEEDKAWANLQ